MSAVQQSLFTSALAAETAAFNAACRERNAHDFFTAEYAAAQTRVDAHYARLRALQAGVPWREWP